MYAIGVDIGTTTISAAVFDYDKAVVADTMTIPNNASVNSAGYGRIQDPETIFESVARVIGLISNNFSPVRVIGLSCQMHGILYIGGDGTAASPFYTWEDGRGDLPTPGGGSYAAELSVLTGYGGLATGFGTVTHFYNMRNGLVPKKAEGFCGIGDYVAMRLTNLRRHRTHISNAAGFALFDHETGGFDTAAAKKAGFDTDFFPAIESGCAIFGETRDGIPVGFCIGDNQASFLGAVTIPAESVLVNIGTGAQITAAGSADYRCRELERRPLTNNMYLHVGSVLCGGRAYGALEKFFRAVSEMAGAPVKDELYGAMDALMNSGDDMPANPLVFSTAFSGTRREPNLRGSIQNIGLDNFTPAHFISGVIDGIIEELYGLYRYFDGAGMRGRLIGSGNGLRKNPLMQKRIAARFGMPLSIPLHAEEAAFGCALYALTACGVYGDLAEAQRMVKYI
jgi:sedoheptulokinase